jgi:hypothetical protein
MGDHRGSDNGRTGAPLVDAEGMAAILMVKDSVNLGPGKPGPQDEWRIPPLPENEVDEKVAQDSGHETASAGHGSGLLHRLTHRG